MELLIRKTVNIISILWKQLFPKLNQSARVRILAF